MIDMRYTAGQVKFLLNVKTNIQMLLMFFS